MVSDSRLNLTLLSAMDGPCRPAKPINRGCPGSLLSVALALLSLVAWPAQARPSNQAPGESHEAPIQTEAPKEDQEPAEQKPAEGQAPAEEQKPGDQAPAEDQKPPEDQAPAKDEKPPEDQAPAEDEKPPEEQAPAGEQKPPEDQVPAEDQKPPEAQPPTEGEAAKQTEPAGEGQAPAEGEAPLERPMLRVGALPADLALDGVLSEPAWAAADSIENLITVEPEEGGVPAGATIVKVLAGPKEIVVGVLCRDADPGGIVSFSKARDSELEEQDHILIVLDTFQDERSGYVFAVNPSAARFDGLVVAQGEEVSSNWDEVWEARTSKDDAGWSAEIRIPIKSLAFKKGSTTWGFNVQRRVQRLQETSRWSGASRDYEVFQTSRAGLLTDLPRFDLGLGLSIRPTLVGDVSKSGPDEDRNYDGTPSLDATKTLGPNLLASLTVNTDFAETEADVRRTNLTRFDLFFPEKRTFFLQGSDIFDFGLGLDAGSQDPDSQVNLIPFFSRQIGLVEVEDEFVEVPIDFGGKIQGRAGETNLGALAVRTGDDPDLGLSATTMGVVRVKQNVLEQSSVGMLATVGDPQGRPGSWMAGADFTYQTTEFRGDKNLLFGLWGLGNDRDDLVEGNKFAYGGKIDYPNDLWDMSLNYMHLGDAFDPSLSFVPRTGKIWEAGAEFRPRPGGDVVRQLKGGMTAYVVADQKTRWESYLLTLKPVDVLFESGDSFELLLEPQGERLVEPFEVEEDIVIEPGTYQWWRYNLVGALADKRKVSGEVGWSWGGFYGGDLRTFEATLILKPSATFTAELGAEFNRVELPQGSFDEDVYTARLQFNFSSDLQISSLLQYDNLSRSLGTNTRLRWTFHPLGDLFIVYNHNMEREFTDRFQFESNQLIVKIRYALRL